jgi:hypothetical protein
MRHDFSAALHMFVFITMQSLMEDNNEYIVLNIYNSVYDSSRASSTPHSPSVYLWSILERFLHMHMIPY